MANSIAASEPVSEINLTNTNPNPNPNPNSFDEFDSLEFPPLDLDYLSNDLPLPEGFISDLFDDDFDFTFDDLENFHGQNGENLPDTTISPSQDSRDSGSCCNHQTSDRDSGACQSAVNGFLNFYSPESPESGVDSASRASSSPPNSDAAAVVADQQIKLEEDGKEKHEDKGGKDEGNGNSLKRKKEEEDEAKTSKIRKSATSSNSSNSSNSESHVDIDDKRKARLMRNRESAQLSRQRKKHYVEELEDKVKSMHAVIADLNNRISYFMAENASLRQQLTVGGGGVCPPPPPGMYHNPMPYPWIPYPMKPQGSQVPLVPIPKLKPQQPLPAPKNRKSDSKKSEGGKSSKTKKVASVSFLGLLFFVLLFGGLVPFIDVNYGARRETVSNGFGNDGLDGRVLTVNGSHPRVGVGLNGGRESGGRRCGSNGVNCKRNLREGVDSKARQAKPGSRSKPDFDGCVNTGNSSEPLVASLYVPRNDKLVKIDGNLIINSVLASERALASEVKNNKPTTASSSEKTQTGLAIARSLAPALAVPSGGMNVDRHPHVYRLSKEPQRALNSGSRDSHKEKTKSSDGSLQKWFREGLEGPIFSSGMCTEVFQFDTSPAPGAIVPASSSASASRPHPPDSTHLSKRNRRILGHLPITLGGEPEFNATKDHTGRPSQDGNFHGNDTVSSMVVSVLVDPRENGDGEGEGVISQKSMSRIFVVVLMDSVKYVTYSCILPLKGSGPHLVTT